MSCGVAGIQETGDRRQEVEEKLTQQAAFYIS